MNKPFSLKIHILVMLVLLPILSLGSNPSSSDRLKKAAEKSKLQEKDERENATEEAEKLNYDKKLVKSESSKKHGKHKH